MSPNIAGSDASKIQLHNKIKIYLGLFGLPHIYIILNPCAAHIPIFQVIFGDEIVRAHSVMQNSVKLHCKFETVLQTSILKMLLFSMVFEHQFHSSNSGNSLLV